MSFERGNQEEEEYRLSLCAAEEVTIYPRECDRLIQIYSYTQGERTINAIAQLNCG